MRYSIESFGLSLKSAVIPEVLRKLKKFTDPESIELCPPGQPNKFPALSTASPPCAPAVIWERLSVQSVVQSCSTRSESHLSGASFLVALEHKAADYQLWHIIIACLNWQEMVWFTFVFRPGGMSTFDKACLKSSACKYHQQIKIGQ